MKMSKSLLMISILFCLTIATGYAFAETAPVSPLDFLGQVLSTIFRFGGLTWVMKISSVVMLLIASMKVSVLNDWFWSKLGNFQAWVAPILGALGGILSIAINGGQINLASIIAYMTAGAGAIVLHELLDTLKAIPGLGAIWVQIIQGIENALGGPASHAKP